MPNLGVSHYPLGVWHGQSETQASRAARRRARGACACACAQLYLEGQHTKNGKRRLIPLNAEARQALLGRASFRVQYCPASPWVFAHKSGERVQYMQNGFGTACARAGIKDFRVHDMRHTFASWLVSAGVPLAEVRDLLGHSTIEMTERYAHLAPDNHVRAVSVLDRSSRFSHADGTREGQQVS